MVQELQQEVERKMVEVIAEERAKPSAQQERTYMPWMYIRQKNQQRVCEERDKYLDTSLEDNLKKHFTFTEK